MIRMNAPEQVREAIKGLRAEAGISQDGVAARTDWAISQQQVNRWENGPRLPSVTSLMRLANVLGYDLALMPREDVPEAAECGCPVFRRQALIEEHTVECSERQAAERFAACISREMAWEGE